MLWGRSVRFTGGKFSNLPAPVPQLDTSPVYIFLGGRNGLLVSLTIQHVSKIDAPGSIDEESSVGWLVGMLERSWVIKPQCSKTPDCDQRLWSRLKSHR